MTDSIHEQRIYEYLLSEYLHLAYLTKTEAQF